MEHTVANLRARGFTVRPATQAVDCTEVVSPQPFWFMRVRDLSSVKAEDILDVLEPANRQQNGESFSLLAAGVYENEFPFAIVDHFQLKQLQNIQARAVAASSAAALAQRQAERANSDLQDFFA